MNEKTKFRLLSRDEFRTKVFARDKNLCVHCGLPAVDAHHILERKLFHDGGYYLENGASLCADCHLLAESTDLSCQEIRAKIGIKSFPLPVHFTEGLDYDKWGNQILPSGDRIKGELFFDVNVQRVLSKNVSFSKYMKYPRTPHLPWSPGMTEDDRVAKFEFVNGSNVVVTEKMDGQNFTMYSDFCHARSVQGSSHPSQSVIRALHASIQNEIPDGWRICGESLYAKHSIGYENLKSFFLVFSIWDDSGFCLSWDQTLEWCELLGLSTVPVLYCGPWDESKIRSIRIDTNQQEGYVVRYASGFRYTEFSQNVAKWVRPNHVQTDKHWSKSQVIPNKLLR